MRDALRTLPCVEASSVKVDKPTKEARFTVKKDSKCDIEAVKKAIKDAGYTVSGVKAPGDDMPLEDVVSLLRQYKSFGVERDEVYSFLTSLRNRVTDEALEDRVLEVADFVSGFCSPHMKVWEP